MEEQKIDLDKVRRDEGRRGTFSQHRPHRKRKKKKILKGILIFLLILLLVYMFAPKDQKSAVSADTAYIPGVYTSSITLGGNAIDVSVTVSDHRIESIAFTHLDEAVETMYPLMQPALDSLAEQICETQSLEDLSYSSDTRYTSQAILGAVERALEKARP